MGSTTIVNEIEVQHHAAKILVLARKSQQEEIGDGANLTVSFAGKLLQNAEELIRTGLHPSVIIIGYTKVINKTIEIFEELVENGLENMNVREKDEVILRMRSAVANKKFGLEDKLCSLIADVQQLCNFDIQFNIYLGKIIIVRDFFSRLVFRFSPKTHPISMFIMSEFAKLLGGGLHDSTIVQGIVLKNDVVGTIKRIEKAKVLNM